MSCSQGISDSPRRQHSQRTETVGAAFASHCWSQFASEILANSDGVGDWFEISCRKFYKTLCWIESYEMNGMYEVLSISWELWIARITLISWVMVPVRVAHVHIFPDGCQPREEVGFLSEMLKTTEQQLVLKGLATEKGQCRRMTMQRDFSWSEIRVSDKYDKHSYRPTRKSQKVIWRWHILFLFPILG